MTSAGARSLVLPGRTVMGLKSPNRVGGEPGRSIDQDYVDSVMLCGG